MAEMTDTTIRTTTPLDELILAGAKATPIHDTLSDRQYALLPPGYTWLSIDDPDRTPGFATATVEVDDCASLIAYANRFRSDRSVLVADIDALTVTAHLDWHPANQGDEGFLVEGERDAHRVILKLRLSEELARWKEMEGKLHDQDAFARFLEENAADVLAPDAASMIELSRDFEATSGQVYKSSIRLDNGDRQLRFETETRAPSNIVIPSEFQLSIPLYNGEEPQTVRALFRWRANDGAVRLGFQWYRLAYVMQAQFNLIAARAAEETGLPVFHGRLR